MMPKLFRRARSEPAFDGAGLGSTLVALPLPAGAAVPAGCCAVITASGGRTRRIEAGGRARLADGETACCFHPGPYSADLSPFACAPELGLRVSFAIDGLDPRVAQQRFDLYLASECSGRLELGQFVGEMETALQRELAQGSLELPPCTTLDEWNAFRTGFNRLLYVRFGVSVDDCVPVDLGEARDFAQVLLARLAEAPPAPLPLPATAVTQVFDAGVIDARALRRLFLELPFLMGGLRLAVLPSGADLFRQQQELLHRLDLASLSAATMPALELAAPGQAIAANGQARRARHSQRATAALDEAWALLARFEQAGDSAAPALFDELDRIVANLELHCAGRRAVPAAGAAS
jgi:hypothetical protein